MPVIFSSAPARCLAPSGPRPFCLCGRGGTSEKRMWSFDCRVLDARQHPHAPARTPASLPRSRPSTRPQRHPHPHTHTHTRARPRATASAPGRAPRTPSRGRAPAAPPARISASVQPPAPARPPHPSSAAASTPWPGRLMVSGREVPGRAGLSRLGPAGPPCRASGMLDRPTPGRVRRARRSGGPGRTGSAWRRAGDGPGPGVVRTRAGGGRRRTREQRGAPRRRSHVGSVRSGPAWLDNGRVSTPDPSLGPSHDGRARTRAREQAHASANAPAAPRAHLSPSPGKRVRSMQQRHNWREKAALPLVKLLLNLVVNLLVKQLVKLLVTPPHCLTQHAGLEHACPAIYRKTTVF